MANVFINELHYDNTGTDIDETIEIAGLAGTDLTGWSLVLYNGANGLVYDTRSLTAVIPNQQNDFGTVTVTYPANGIQNGSPDGIALIDNNNVVQFLSYEGSFIAVDGPAAGQISTDIGVIENTSTPVGFSLQLQGTGSAATDFSWSPAAPSSFGTANAGQTFGLAAQPDLTISQTDSPDPVALGNSLTYTLTVSNTGGANVSDVSVEYALPSGVSAGTTVSSGFTASQSGEVITFSGGSIDAGSSATLTVNVTPTAPGTLTSGTAVVDPSNAIAESNETNNTAAAISTTVTAAASVRIRDIQGASHVSPLVGQAVSNVAGIVTVVRSNGFYIQDPNPDNNDATSEGIFIFTSAAPNASIGDSVLVSGTVSEFRPGGTGGSDNLSLTQIGGNPTITKLNSGNSLPPATAIGNGGRAIPTQVIDNDAVGGTVENPATPFDPAQDGIDFYESLEGMLVQVNNAVAVGPTNDFGEIPVLADNGANAGTRTTRSGILIQPGDFNPERIILDDVIISSEPQVNVGDQFNGEIVGVIDYSFGNFKLLNTASLPAVTSGGLTRETTNLTGDTDKLTVATFNVENLDPGDGSTKFNSLASLIVNNLKTPDILNLEEVQDNNGPVNDSVVDASLTYQTLIDAIAAAGGPSYEYRQINPVDDQDGGEPGGNIRVGFLFNPNRVQFVDRLGGTSTTNTTVNSTPSGPVFASPGRLIDTDLSNGDAFANSRKPLVGEFLFNHQRVFVVGNHFNSKGGDQPLFGRFQLPALTSEAQRLQQAQIVNDFVDSVLAADPNANVVVMGDLNDFQFSNPIATLKDGVLSNLVDTLPLNEQYTYVFEGNSQVLDHILVSNNLSTNADAELDIVHINSEFTDQISDHDPLVARFNLPQRLNTIDGTSGRDTLIGTNGNDQIVGGLGADILTGGDGKDEFVYTSIRDSGDRITDFTVGSDKIVLTQLLDSLVAGGYNGTNGIDDGYVRLVLSGSSHTSLQIDQDGLSGAAIFRPFLTVENVSLAASNTSNFVF